jgi:S-DNA-T family DNA segregation ATPase FtsK/SpoIIIE
MLVGGGPLLAGIHTLLLEVFGVGWPVPVAAALALGGVLIWPEGGMPRPIVVGGAAIAGLAMFGLLSIGSHPAGGALGAAIGDLVAGLAGRPGAVVVLVVLLLLGLVVAFRFSPGGVLLRTLHAGQAAYAERRRLDGLVRRTRTERPEPRTGSSSLPNAALDPLMGLAGKVKPPPARPGEAGAGVDAAVEPDPTEPVDAPLPLPLAEASAGAPVAGEEEEGELPPDVGEEADEPPPQPGDDVLRVAADLEDDVDQWEGITWNVPPLSLLDSVKARRERLEEEIKRNVKTIEGTLTTFGVQARVVGVNSGPAVTQYELQPAAGVPVKKIVSLQNDLSLALAASPLRIEAPIPGKSAVGLEVPNKAAGLVTIREVVESSHFQESRQALPVVLGNDVTGQPVVGDLTRMPHLLIAGATGQGKSVCINALIASLLLRSTPTQLRLVLVDPKRVELSFYNDLPHLGVPVIVEPHQAAAALRWAVVEMDRRYKLLSAESVRNVQAYNEKAVQQGARALPYIVIVIDELADLMMVAAGEVEELICRIAQLARAVGIHLVVATQRPSTDIITGLIKANMPSRIAFAVGSQVDSRVILDSGGAEKLLGRGDMLYQPIDSGKPTRIQGAFVSATEVERLVASWKRQADPQYMEDVLTTASPEVEEAGGGTRRMDPLFGRAARAVCTEGAASVSLIQRKFNVGYSRAGRIVDALAEHRVIGAYQGSKSREVLMTLPDVDDLLERLGIE